MKEKSHQKTTPSIQDNKPLFPTKAQPQEHRKNFNKLNQYPTIQKIQLKSAGTHWQTT